MFSFIELWEQVDQALLIDATGDDDDIRSLKSLRNEVIREVRLSREGMQLSHSTLISILMRVRDEAVNRVTWEDAIRSAGGSSSSPSRMHSISALSRAIRVMLEEYLKGADQNARDSSVETVPADSPPIEGAKIGVDCERIDSLLEEIDSLKDKLTESECKMSKLFEEKESLEDQLGEYRKCAAKIEEEKLKGKFRLVELEAKCKSLEVELSLFKEVQRDLPTVEVWRSSAEKLQLMESQQQKEAEQFLSQIHTLEVQKEDAEAELTRLRSEMKHVSDRTRAPSVVSSCSRRFGGLRTVSIFGNPGTPSISSTRRSSLAEEFVNLSLINRF